jgi:hypothetical protein
MVLREVWPHVRSHHTTKDDALTELQQYDCELPTPDSGRKS